MTNKMLNDLSMEELNKLKISMHDLTEEFFKKYNKKFTIKESDELSDAIDNVINKLANYPDYRNYN